MDPMTLLGMSNEDNDVLKGDDAELTAFTELHLLQLETFDHNPIEVECTGKALRPPADCLLGELVLLLQFSAELDDSVLPSPSENRRSSVQVGSTDDLIHHP